MPERRISTGYSWESQEYPSLNTASAVFLLFSTDITLARALRVLANIRKFLGISMWKRKKNGASLPQRRISTGYSWKSQGYPSLNSASADFLLFFCGYSLKYPEVNKGLKEVVTLPCFVKIFSLMYFSLSRDYIKKLPWKLASSFHLKLFHINHLSRILTKRFFCLWKQNHCHEIMLKKHEKRIFLGISMENGASWLERWISIKLSGISLKFSGISISQAS